jgi:hypothetical protein
MILGSRSRERIDGEKASFIWTGCCAAGRRNTVTGMGYDMAMRIVILRCIRFPFACSGVS